MDNLNKYRAVFCRRLKYIRKQKGISQKQLGILAGIDEFVASSRINRYEKGIHEADLETVGKISEVLNVPLAYFFAEDETLAEMIYNYNSK